MKNVIIVLAVAGFVTMLVMVLLLLAEAIKASDVKATTRKGRGFKKALNPINFYHRLMSHESLRVVLWATLTPVWGWPVFVIFYTIFRAARCFDKNPKTDTDCFKPA